MTTLTPARLYSELTFKTNLFSKPHSNLIIFCTKLTCVGSCGLRGWKKRPNPFPFFNWRKRTKQTSMSFSSIMSPHLSNSALAAGVRFKLWDSLTSDAWRAAGVTRVCVARSCAHIRHACTAFEVKRNQYGTLPPFHFLHSPITQRQISSGVATSNIYVVSMQWHFVISDTLIEHFYLLRKTSLGDSFNNCKKFIIIHLLCQKQQWPV